MQHRRKRGHDMASHHPLRTADHRSGRRARDRALIRVRRATALIGITAAASAVGLGVVVASETTVPSSASAADRVTSSSTSTGAGRTTTTSASSAASASGDASAGTASTSDPTTTTTTAPPPNTHRLGPDMSALVSDPGAPSPGSSHRQRRRPSVVAPSAPSAPPWRWRSPTLNGSTRPRPCWPRTSALSTWPAAGSGRLGADAARTDRRR